MCDIYWANALFSQADRDFNLTCAKHLRNIGYTVFLPQELSINHKESPTEIDIFSSDTKAIEECGILIACIDQETIDAGVACEIGIAHVLKKCIIGLYTDIRRDRINYKIYKNPYVIGAILASGLIVHSMDELVYEMDYRRKL